MKYRFIHEHAGEFGIRRLCRVMRVSPSAWYAWQKKPVASSPDDVDIKARLKALFTASRGGAGSRTLAKKLCEEGVAVSRWRVMKPNSGHATK